MPFVFWAEREILQQFTFTVSSVLALSTDRQFSHRVRVSPQSLGEGWSRARPCWRWGCRGWWGCRSSRESSCVSWWWRWCRGRARGSTRTSPRSSLRAPLRTEESCEISISGGLLILWSGKWSSHCPVYQYQYCWNVISQFSDQTTRRWWSIHFQSDQLNVSCLISQFWLHFRFQNRKKLLMFDVIPAQLRTSLFTYPANPTRHSSQRCWCPHRSQILEVIPAENRKLLYLLIIHKRIRFWSNQLKLQFWQGRYHLAKGKGKGEAIV